MKATREGLDALDEFEQAKLGYSLLTLLRRAESIHYQELQGTLEREAWLGIQQSLRGMLEIPAVHAWWNDNSSRFSESFQRYVESDLMGS